MSNAEIVEAAKRVGIAVAMIVFAWLFIVGVSIWKG